MPSDRTDEKKLTSIRTWNIALYCSVENDEIDEIKNNIDFNEQSIRTTAKRMNVICSALCGWMKKRKKRFYEIFCSKFIFDRYGPITMIDCLIVTVGLKWIAITNRVTYVLSKSKSSLSYTYCFDWPYSFTYRMRRRHMHRQMIVIMSKRDLSIER